MALVNSAFTVNVTPGAMPPIVHVSEYDVGRTYTVTINGENGSAFNIPTGTTATIEGTLNGSVGFTQSATISNNQVSFALSESMTAYSGKAWCKIKLTLNDEPIQTCAFILDVDRAGVEADTVIGASGFEEQITNAVNGWLESDEGIEDAVQDSVNEYASEHGIVVSNGFVTPEDYGAKGNGTTDDTAAIQLAVDSGRNVMFGYNKTYKCGTVNVTKNIEIDCRWSKFICTAETLFNCMGKVDSSVGGADYVANEPYVLPNSDKYTGFALLRSTDNVITMRDYYYGGFVTLFAEGVCNDCRPVGFTGVTVDKITPIICRIKNVGNVVFDAVRDRNTVIKCTYGLNCEFSGFDVDGDYYSIVSLKTCYRCKARDVNGYLTYTGTLANYYAISLGDSSECVVEDCHLTSDFWHCYDIGGNYLCFDNAVRNCKFHADSGAVAYNNHANAIGSIIENCEIDNMGIGAGTIIRNCTVNENTATKGASVTQCYVNFHPTNIGGINTLYIDKLILKYADSGSAEFVGVYIRPEAYTTGNTFVVDDVKIKNLYTSHDRTLTRLPFALGYYPTPSSGALTVNGVITLENVIGYLYMHQTNIFPNVAFGANSKMLVCNSRRVDNNGQGLLRFGTATSHRYHPNIEVRDCIVWRMDGKYETLKLHNVFGTASILVISSATTLTGDNITKPNNAATMKSGLADAKLTNVWDNVVNLWPYLYISNGSGNYGLLGANGIENKVLQ